MWSRGASTTDPAARTCPTTGSRAYSGTSPTSPGARGSAGAASVTVRVRGSAVASASAEASIPDFTHTASATAPAPSMPSPDPPGSRTARWTGVRALAGDEVRQAQPTPARVRHPLSPWRESVTR